VDGRGDAGGGRGVYRKRGRQGEGGFQKEEKYFFGGLFSLTRGMLS